MGVVLEGVLRQEVVNALVVLRRAEADLSFPEAARLCIQEEVLPREVVVRACVAAFPVPQARYPAAFQGWASCRRWSAVVVEAAEVTWSWTEPQTGPKLSWLRM